MVWECAWPITDKRILRSIHNGFSHNGQTHPKGHLSNQTCCNDRRGLLYSNTRAKACVKSKTWSNHRRCCLQHMPIFSCTRIFKESSLHIRHFHTFICQSSIRHFLESLKFVSTESGEYNKDNKVLANHET